MDQNKRTVGAVILADNTGNFNYIDLAKFASDRIKTHLNIDTVIITSDDTVQGPEFIKVSDPIYNSRIFKYDTSRRPWKNLNRTLAYEKSPWDITLLVDADFFISSDALIPHINADKTVFSIARKLYDPTTGFEYETFLGKTKIPQMWATLMIFDKKYTMPKTIFNLAQYVIDNYHYYATLYGFNTNPIRNDYAFSIACHIAGGYGQVDYSMKGYAMANCDYNASLSKLSANSQWVTYKKPGSDHEYTADLSGLDVHFQEKHSLFLKLNEFNNESKALET